MSAKCHAHLKLLDFTPNYNDTTLNIQLPLPRVLSSFTFTKSFAPSRRAYKDQSVGTIVHPLFPSIRVVSFT